MEITNGADQHLDRSFSSSQHFGNITDYAWKEGTQVYDSHTHANQDRVPSGYPSGNQFLKKLGAIYDTKSLFRIDETHLAHRQRELITDPARSAGWGGQVSFIGQPVNTFMQSNSIQSTYAPFEATESTLPGAGLTKVQIAIHNFDLAPWAVVDATKSLACTLILRINLSFTLNGVEAYPGTTYKNAVAMSDNAFLTYAKNLIVEYNGIHTRETHTPFTNISRMSTWDQTKIDRCKECMSGQQTMDQFITYDNPDSGELTYGDDIFGPLLDITNSRDPHTAAVNLFKSAAGSHIAKGKQGPFTRVIRKVQTGPLCPRYEQPTGVIGTVPATYENQHHLNVTPSGTYGLQSKQTTMTIEEKSKVLRVHPGKVKLQMNMALSLRVSDTAEQVKYIHTTVAPYIGDGSKLSGGDLISHKMINTYLEMPTEINNKLAATTSFYTAQVPRANSDHLPPRATTFSLPSSNYGMLTQGVCIGARVMKADEKHYGAGELMNRYGTLDLKPVIEVTHGTFSSGDLPPNIDRAVYDNLVSTGTALPNPIPNPLFGGGTADERPVRDLLNPLNLIGLSRREEIIGYEVSREKLLKTLGIGISTTEFLTDTDVENLCASGLNLPVPPNNLEPQIMHIAYAKGGSDSSTSSAGMNTSRTPSHNIHGSLMPVEDQVNNTQIDHCLHTKNLTMVDRATMHHIMA